MKRVSIRVSDEPVCIFDMQQDGCVVSSEHILVWTPISVFSQHSGKYAFYIQFNIQGGLIQMVAYAKLFIGGVFIVSAVGIWQLVVQHSS